MKYTPTMSLLERVRQSLKKKEINSEEGIQQGDQEDAKFKDDANVLLESESKEEDLVIVDADADDDAEPEAEDYYPDFEESFTFYEKKWVIAPFMNEIRAGDLEKIPIECMFSHYILFSAELHCFYIALENHESGDEFEIYEFDWVGEVEEPEFKEITHTMNASDCAKNLAQRISDGYLIYIPERLEFEEAA